MFNIINTSICTLSLATALLCMLVACANSKSKNTESETPVDALSGKESNPNINWITIHAGEFTFGSSEDTPCRAPIPETQFNVRLTRAFVMAESEITQAQWEELDLPNPSQNIGSEKPVTFVNFYEALVWCNKLSNLEKLEPCYNLSSCKNPVGTGCGSDEKWPEEGCRDTHKNFTYEADIHKYSDYYACPGYRLPTSAEWEYAAKAGTIGHTYNGEVHTVPLSYCEEEPALEDIAWYCNNSDDELHPVKQKQPNPWGLYDMLGNVYEWTDYYFHGQALDSSDNDLILTDPVGPQTGDTMELRGGAFNETGCYARPSRPLFADPYAKSYTKGFRPVRTLFEDDAGDSTE